MTKRASTKPASIAAKEKALRAAIRDKQINAAERAIDTLTSLMDDDNPAIRMGSAQSLLKVALPVKKPSFERQVVGVDMTLPPVALAEAILHKSIAGELPADHADVLCGQLLKVEQIRLSTDLAERVTSLEEQLAEALSGDAERSHAQATRIAELEGLLARARARDDSEELAALVARLDQLEQRGRH